MEDSDSLIGQFGGIERQIRSIMNAAEAEVAGANKAKQAIRRLLENSRKMLRDFELEEDARAQAKLLPQSEEYLKSLRAKILDASQHGIFSAVDVAQISANIDQLIERLG